MQRRDFLTGLTGTAALPAAGASTFFSPPGPTDRQPLPDVVDVRAFGAVGDGETDDTEAIQAAIEAGVSGVVFLPVGQYLVGGLELPADLRVVGASISGSYLKVRPGFEGVVVSDRGNGTRIQLENLVLDCTDQAAGHGIELGFAGVRSNHEHNYLAWLRGVRVFGCPGTAFRIRSNVSELVDVWASNGNGVGMELEGTVVRGYRLGCEGSAERELVVRCMDADLRGIHVETDVRDNPILVDGYGAVLDGLTLSIGPDVTIQDVIRLSARTSGAEIRGVRINLNQPGSDYVHLVRDDAWAVTLPKDDLHNPRHLGVYRQRGVASYPGDLHGPLASPPRTLADGDATPSVHAGTVFRTANSRSTTLRGFVGGADGQEITLLLDGNTTIASNDSIRLREGRDFRAERNGTVTLVRIDGVWYEKSRSAR